MWRGCDTGRRRDRGGLKGGCGGSCILIAEWILEGWKGVLSAMRIATDFATLAASNMAAAVSVVCVCV